MTRLAMAWHGSLPWGLVEPNTTILTRIRAAHPAVVVTRPNGEAWRAMLPDPGEAERVIVRNSLADLEQALDMGELLLILALPAAC
jgi:hypothetical protein